MDSILLNLHSSVCNYNINQGSTVLQTVLYEIASPVFLLLKYLFIYLFTVNTLEHAWTIWNTWFVCSVSCGEQKTCAADASKGLLLL
jgi:hypothetical protein